MDNKTRKSLSIRFIVNCILFFVIIAGLLYITSLFSIIYFPGNGAFRELSIEFKNVGIGIFAFFKPFVQLIIILLILEWILNKFGINLGNKITKFDWNVQTLIGIIIIFGFVIAALSGISGVSYLKDIALVVVGFYFGTQRKAIEYESNGKKVKVTEEHTNDVDSNNS